MINKIILSIFALLLSIKAISSSVDYSYQTLADNLSHPWGLAVIDENNILFTELSGQLRKIENGVLNQKPITGVPEVLFAGQGGLSGIILDPNFKEKSKIYIAYIYCF